MTDKKQEWEIGYSRENPATPISEAKTVSFDKPETLVGQMLDGRFLIEKDLTDGGADAGGIGLVYLAKDMKLMGKETVVKILQKALVTNQDIARKFQHEKEALIRLDHPNIVRILDSGELSDGNPFMVMEFIEGYSLRRKLNAGKKLDFKSVAHYIEAITNALSVAHSKKILHRDIKPENIMLTPQDEGFERVRLIDFGIARVEDSILAPATTIERGIGTILYIAPEQLAGRLEQTPAVDIYSLAIVGYEMLTGELPFNPTSVVEMYQLQKEEVKISPRTLRPDLPESAEKILLSALSFDAEKRPQNARQFGRELANALREKTNLSVAKTEPALANLAVTQPSSVVSNPNPQILPTEPSPAPVHTDFSQFLPTPQTAKKSSKIGLFAGIGALILVIGAAGLGFFLWKNNPVINTENSSANRVSNVNTAAEPTKPLRKLTYYLDVQKTRNGRPFGESFESSGREIFENGYMFRFNFTGAERGYFYLFNEGKDSAGKINFNLLHPVPLSGKDNALTEKDKPVQTEWNIFGGTPGTEKIWLIWTLEKQNVLEDAVKEAFSQQGKVADADKKEALSRFLEENSKQKLNAELEKDDRKKRTNLNGESDKVAYLLELEHK